MQVPVAAVAVAIPIEVATQVAAEVEVAVSAAHSAMKMPNSKRNLQQKQQRIDFCSS